MSPNNNKTQRRLALSENKQTRNYSKDEYKKRKKLKQQRQTYTKKQEQNGVKVKKYKKYDEPSIYTIKFE